MGVRPFALAALFGLLLGGAGAATRVDFGVTFPGVDGQRSLRVKSALAARWGAASVVLEGSPPAPLGSPPPPAPLPPPPSPPPLAATNADLPFKVRASRSSSGAYDVVDISLVLVTDEESKNFVTALHKGYEGVENGLSIHPAPFVDPTLQSPRTLVQSYANASVPPAATSFVSLRRLNETACLDVLKTLPEGASVDANFLQVPSDTQAFYQVGRPESAGLAAVEDCHVIQKSRPTVHLARVAVLANAPFILRFVVEVAVWSGSSEVEGSYGFEVSSSSIPTGGTVDRFPFFSETDDG